MLKRAKEVTWVIFPEDSCKTARVQRASDGERIKDCAEDRHLQLQFKFKQIK
jgi:hypothetical protein